VSSPALGLTMLALIVIAIMMGFPTAFTLMGLGMIFGYIAFWVPGLPWYDNRIFDLIVQRTYGVMTNDTLLSIPLFVFMGYIMERAALVDRMFHSVQLAFRRIPASLAVTTLLVCAFWGIASGIVGAVVVLMGVIALRPMLRAGYDVKLASGVITAGGTLGILIPPSVMLIVYAAVAGQSIVKLYAAAMLPGFFLTFLYLVYILGWALINPKIAPKLPPDQFRIAVPEYVRRLERGPSRRVIPGLVAALFRPRLLQGATGPDGKPVRFRLIWTDFVDALIPVILAVATFGAGWWYVAVHNAPRKSPPGRPRRGARRLRWRRRLRGPREAPGAGLRRGDRHRRVAGGRRGTARRDDLDRGGLHPIDGGAHPRALLPVVLGAGRALGGAARRLLLPHGREQLGDLEAADLFGRAPRRAHLRGPGGDPVRHHHRHGVRGDRCARCPVPRGHGEVSGPGPVVEPGRGRWWAAGSP